MLQMKDAVEGTVWVNGPNLWICISHLCFSFQKMVCCYLIVQCGIKLSLCLRLLAFSFMPSGRGGMLNTFILGNK